MVIAVRAIVTVAWQVFNTISWWLLPARGAAGVISRHGGYSAFVEFGKQGAIPRGGAVHTSACCLPLQAPYFSRFELKIVLFGYCGSA